MTKWCEKQILSLNIRIQVVAVLCCRCRLVITSTFDKTANLRCRVLLAGWLAGTHWAEIGRLNALYYPICFMLLCFYAPK